MQQGAPAISTTSAVAATVNSPRLSSSRPTSTSQEVNVRPHSDTVHSSAAAHSRRIALEYASSHSNGYFISVGDSQFGNHILPAIPRLEDS